jgi:uncharacterized protein (DUF58 family)
MMTPRCASITSRLGRALTYNFCPEFDRRLLAWLRNPLTILALGMASSTLCGFFLHPRAFVLTIGISATLILGIAWPWITTRGLSGRVIFGSERAREGETVLVSVTVRNRAPWAAAGLTVRLAPDEASSVGLEHAPGFRSVSASWGFTPSSRGEYPTVLPRIGSGFPFGLWEASRALEVPRRLLVWPRTFPLGAIPLGTRGRMSEGVTPLNLPGTSGDVLGLREYRRGDSLRRVHWPQTARQGRLIVCEMQSNAVPDVQIVLDVAQRSHAGVGPAGSREWAIRIAASFAESWINQGAGVEIVFNGQVVSARSGAVQTRRTRILDALAKLTADGLLGLTDLLDLPACRRFDGGLRIVVTTDLGLRRLNGTGARDPKTHFVVLKAAAFDGSESCPTPDLPTQRPWIWIDDPDQVPQYIQQTRKEVLLDH